MKSTVLRLIIYIHRVSFNLALDDEHCAEALKHAYTNILKQMVTKQTNVFFFCNRQALIKINGFIIIFFSL